VVLSPGEISRLLPQMNGVTLLMAKLIYGGGLRCSECIRLRVRDMGFDRGSIVVRSGKGRKDRMTLFPQSLHQDVTVSGTSWASRAR
jgi:site-specific recombinase XerD